MDSRLATQTLEPDRVGFRWGPGRLLYLRLWEVPQAFQASVSFTSSLSPVLEVKALILSLQGEGLTR